MRKSIKVNETIFILDFDSEWEEYRIRVFENEELNINRNYFTTEKEDAEDTLKEMVNEEKNKQERKTKMENEKPIYICSECGKKIKDRSKIGCDMTNVFCLDCFDSLFAYCKENDSFIRRKEGKKYCVCNFVHSCEL